MKVRANGKIYTFPDGTSPDEIRLALEEYFSAQGITEVSGAASYEGRPATPDQFDRMMGDTAPVATPLLTGQEAFPGTGEIPELGPTGEMIMPEQQPRPEQDPILAKERLLGAAEVLTTLATAPTTGTLGMLGGTIGGLTAAILRGEFGTPEAARLIEQAAAGGMEQLTYAPRTEAGQQYMQAIAEPLEAVPAFVPAMGAAGAIPAALTAGGQAVRTAAPRVAEAARRVMPQRPMAGELMERPQEVGPARVMPEGIIIEEGVPPRSVGAAEVPVAVKRREVAAQMPVPFEGRTGLTAGQATRDFAQLQFEKETAKLGEIGAPLRERVQAQTANFIDNFDALIDLPVPIEREVRAIGMAVDKAITTKAEVQRKKIQKLYQRADELGETADLVEMQPLLVAFADLERFEGVAGNVKPIRQEATRLGAIAVDEDGALVAQQMSIKDAELLRQFVNQATDWADKRQSLMARKINAAIDSSTDGLGGEIYKKARRERAKYAEEFENVGLTAKLLAKKGNTSERAIAFEDVFNKIIILSPVEEMNKLRRTLLKAGPDGRQAWADLKAQGIEFIKDRSLSVSQKDSAGNPALSPNQLNKVISSLDAAGKLESLYGKKIAQQLRDLAELSTAIYTAPNGAVNFSNSASAIANAVDTILTYGISGMPIAGRAVLKESLDYIKNRKLKARIREALKEPKE